jgi:hypothetical protein
MTMGGRRSLLIRRSLAATVDRANEALFYGRSVTKSEREEVARWIAGRQGKPGSYAGRFAPTPADYSSGIRLFTGERIATGAATGHILGEEASRLLILLGFSSAEIDDALERAGLIMKDRLRAAEREGRWDGTYCCGPCSAALWRHLAAGGLESGERRLARGIATLRSRRDGKGRWGRFPFYYTLLALSEVSLEPATREMRYASPACERVLRRAPRGDEFDRRRRLLAARVLERC